MRPEDFVGVISELGDNVVKVKVVVVLGDRFGVLEFAIIGVKGDFTDGERGGGTDKKLIVDKFDKIFEHFILLVNEFGCFD
jgi:hypothetical protein